MRMHPRLAELFTYIDQEHDALRSAYEAVPADRRAMRPSPETWSVDDVIGHLTLIERRLATVLGNVIAQARAGGLPNESASDSVLERINAGRWSDRSMKFKGPAVVDPRTAEIVYSWSDYDETRRRLKDVLLGGDGLALEQVSHPHVIMGPLSIYEWIGFMGGHAARHAAQIREIAATLTSDVTPDAPRD